jgi:ferric-dicitrate binding protein FerR (iron transport regulator)
MGEAYFDVAHNPETPFKIELPSNLNIEVLGTSFNVKDYPEDSEIETSLFTGSIKLYASNNEKISSVLEPGTVARYEKVHQTLNIAKINDPKAAIAWQNEQLVFSNSTLQDIVNELNRFFDSEITIADPDLRTTKFTASFKAHTPLQNVLENLQLTGNFFCKKNSENKWEIIKK